VGFLFQVTLGKIPTTPIQDLILRPCPQEFLGLFCSPQKVHQKVLLSNLGVTVLVRHLVDLVKQVTIVCPQGRKEFSIVFSIFVPYHSKKKKTVKKCLQMLPLFS
jgi:hypothetical protein